VRISTLEAALAYAGCCLAVFPVPPDSKKSYKSEKYSAGRKWGATNDPAEIRRDFTRWPDARIGIPTGAVNRIVVVTSTPWKGTASTAALHCENLRRSTDRCRKRCKQSRRQDRSITT
jgi:hypothetical protein